MGMFERSGGSDQGSRRYKVALFGEPIGAFVMPIGYHMDNPEALMRPIVARPYREGWDDAPTYYWPEPDSEGGFVTVYWNPEAPEEREEAARFYNTAHGLNPDGSVDQSRQPPIPTRTNEETQLVRAALANPEAQDPFGAYADWLARKGDPYAEYIRLALKTEPLAEDDEYRERLEERQDDLVDKHGAKWVRGLTDLGLFPGYDWQDPEDFDPGWWFGEKGVIEELTIPGGTFVFRKNPARLFAAAPFLRNLTVNDPEITVADLAAIPEMAQIDWLHVQVGAGSEDAYRVFATSPYLGGLRWLTLYGYGFGPDVAAMLARAPWMTNLRGLAVGTNALGDDGTETFAESPQCTNLEMLGLNNNGATDRGLIAVCQSPHLARLKHLELPLNAFTAEGVRALAAATFAPALEHLDLAQCGLDSAALAVLASAAFPALKELDVSNHKVGDAAMRALVAAPYFRRLELFRANECDLSNAIARDVAGCGPTALRELALGGNRIDDAGIEALLYSKAVRNVKVLDLSGNRFATDGVLALADADLPALEELDLTGVRLGKEEVLALVKARWRRQITELGVSDDEVGPRGREVLLDRFGEDVVTFYD